jgi:AcrR family transcriptional regulator
MTTRLTRAEQVQRNRGLLLEAARRVFLAEGYSGATIDAIALDAGFSKGVVYSQFASKADLFLVLIEQRIERRAQENAAVIESADGEPETSVVDLLHRGARRSEEEAAWARLLIEFRVVAARDEVVNARYADLHEQAIDALANLLGRVCERSRETLPVPPRTMAKFLLALDSGVTLERSVSPDSMPASELDEFFSRALGLGAMDQHQPATAGGSR